MGSPPPPILRRKAQTYVGCDLVGGGGAKFTVPTVVMLGAGYPSRLLRDQMVTFLNLFPPLSSGPGAAVGTTARAGRSRQQRRSVSRLHLFTGIVPVFPLSTQNHQRSAIRAGREVERGISHFFFHAGGHAYHPCPRTRSDLNLKAHGLELLRRNPSSFTPLLDGRHLMMGPDADMTHREIAKFSARDADAFPAYEAMLDSMVDFIEPFLDEAPVEPHDLSMRQVC